MAKARTNRIVMNEAFHAKVLDDVKALTSMDSGRLSKLCFPRAKLHSGSGSRHAHLTERPESSGVPLFRQDLTDVCSGRTGAGAVIALDITMINTWVVVALCQWKSLRVNEW